MARLGVLLVGGLCALLLNMCSGANNPIAGVVRANMAGHAVIVTDCYLLDVPPVERLRTAPGADGASDARWRFAPCSDAVIVIEGDQLTVNGIGYGAIAHGDEIVVDHGVVYVNGHLRTTI